MNTAPLLLIFLAAVVTGGYTLMAWLRREQKPMLIGVHLLLGLGAAEASAHLLRMSDLAYNETIRPSANTALMLVAIAILTGFGAPLLRRNVSAANASLAVHVGVGLAAFLMVLTISGKL